MSRNGAITEKSCPTQKAEDGHKKHDFPDAASPDIRPERKSRTAKGGEDLAPSCRKVGSNMRRGSQQQSTPWSAKTLRAQKAVQNGRGHEQHQARMRQTTMTKGFCQKAGKDLHPTPEHGALGIDIGQKTAQQTCTDREWFRRKHMPAHGTQHGKAADQ